jgi:hypothetical protein
MAISGVVLRYPSHSELLAGLVGMLSGLKFCAYALTLMAIISLAVQRATHRVFVRPSGPLSQRRRGVGK